MNFTQALTSLFNDNLVIYALVLVALDFILGVAAAVKTKTFKLSYIADLAKTDILAKLVPWAALYVGWKLAPSAGSGPLNLEAAADSVYALIVAAWIGSILASLAHLGINIGPAAFTRGEKT